MRQQQQTVRGQWHQQLKLPHLWKNTRHAPAAAADSKRRVATQLGCVRRECEESLLRIGEKPNTMCRTRCHAGARNANRLDMQLLFDDPLV
jgi:hypothetical protein